MIDSSTNTSGIANSALYPSKSFSSYPLDLADSPETNMVTFEFFKFSRWSYRSPVPWPTTSPAFLQLSKFTPSPARKRVTLWSFFSASRATNNPKVTLFLDSKPL